MRVAVVMTGGLHPSGREQIIPGYLTLFSTMARRHEIHAFTLRHLAAPTTYSLDGIVVHDLGSPAAPLGFGRVAQWRALRRALADAGPFDVVHGMWADPAGLLAALAGRRFGIPSVVTCMTGEFVACPDIDYGLQRTPFGRAVVRTTSALASRVHVASRHAAALAARCGIAPTTFPLGLNVADEDVVLDRPDGPPWRLLQVASLNRVKNQACLVEAVALLAGTMDVRLDLIGEDTLGGALQAAAVARGVADRITFHGFLPQDAIVPLRARAHLYVQTSRHEGAGVSVLEAAASGLPVLGTRVGYVADWSPSAAEAIDDPSGPALAGAIARLLADPSRRAALARNALAFAREHDVHWSVDKLERLYREAGVSEVK
jgi:glycosyltransferase involved in cell wall biosynthesis